MTDTTQATAQPNEGATPESHRGSGSPTASGLTLVGAWAVSVLIHLVGLAVMFALVFPHSSGDAPIVPETRVEIVGDVRAAAFDVETRTEPTENTPTTQPLEARYQPKAFDKPPSLTSSIKPELPVIGIAGSAGDFSQYGLSVESASGPEFFGLGAQARGARRIVYVVDRSGSMVDTFHHVRRELQRSIGALRRSQKFHVIFFNAGAPLENPPRKLVSAIAAHKNQLFEFLTRVQPEGSTDPAGAMRRAFLLEPDLIYFLTDGEFDANLMAKLDRWNRQRHVRIFTIAYFDAGGASLLERIARNHNGEFRFVTEHDLP